MAWKTKLAELLVDIKANLAPLKSAMAKAGAVVRRGMATMTRWAKRGAIAIGVALVAALAYATKAAIKQEDAEIDLVAALKATGDATQENIDRLKKYASALQKTTTYGDEEILAQMAYAKNLGVTTDQLEGAAKAAIGLAATYKLDLSAAMMLVGRASQGQTQMLTRYGIVLKEGLTDQQKFNEVLRIGAEGFVLAEDAAKGARGTLTRLWNVIGDIAEVIAKPLLDRLKEAAENTMVWVKANEELIKTRVGTWVDNLVGGLEKLKPVMLFVGKHWKMMMGVMAVVLAAPAIAAIGKIVSVLAIAGAAATRTVIALRGLFVSLAKYIGFVYGAKTIAQAKIIERGGRAIRYNLKQLTGLYKVVAKYSIKLILLFKSITIAIKAASAATIAWTAVWVTGIGIIIVQVGLLIRALWQIHSAKKKWRKLEQAATKEEIEAYKAKIRAIKDETTEKRKAAKAAVKKAETEAKAAKQARLDAVLRAEKAKAQAIGDAAEKEAELEKVRQDGIDALEKQLVMYKELTGYEQEILNIEFKLRKERARDIGKELGISGVGVLDNIELKMLREIEAEKKRIADETAQAARDEKAEQRSLFRDELSTLEALFTNATGYEKKLEKVKKSIRREDAKDIAAKTKVSFDEALRILDAKMTIASVKVGLVGFEQAWAQIATGASQTEKEIMKYTKETAKWSKETVGQLKTMKMGGQGFGP